MILGELVVSLPRGSVSRVWGKAKGLLPDDEVTRHERTCCDCVKRRRWWRQFNLKLFFKNDLRFNLRCASHFAARFWKLMNFSNNLTIVRVLYDPLERTFTTAYCGAWLCKTRQSNEIRESSKLGDSFLFANNAALFSSSPSIASINSCSRTCA